MGKSIARLGRKNKGLLGKFTGVGNRFTSKNQLYQLLYQVYEYRYCIKYTSTGTVSSMSTGTVSRFASGTVSSFSQGMVDGLGLSDVNEVGRVAEGGVRFPFTFESRTPGGGKSRIDRIYVGGGGMESTVTSFGGRTILALRLTP